MARLVYIIIWLFSACKSRLDILSPGKFVRRTDCVNRRSNFRYETSGKTCICVVLFRCYKYRGLGENVSLKTYNHFESKNSLVALLNWTETIRDDEISWEKLSWSEITHAVLSAVNFPVKICDSKNRYPHTKLNFLHTKSTQIYDFLWVTDSSFHWFSCSDNFTFYFLLKRTKTLKLYSSASALRHRNGWTFT